MNIEVFGWLGALLLSVCGLPQMIESIIKRKTEGISITFLWSWFVGEILTLIYISSQNVLSIQLLLNYSLNVVFIAVILYYYYFPGQKSVKVQ